MSGALPVLVHPPFADPTQPYVSLPTLKGWLGAKGIAVRVLDLNVRAAHHLFDEAALAGWVKRLGERLATLDRATSLSAEEAHELTVLAGARRAAELCLAMDPSPLEVLRSERFYDPQQYEWARQRSDAVFELLSAVAFPFRYGWNHVTHHTVPWSFELLASYCTEHRSPLAAFYRAAVRALPAHTPFVGVSVAFPSQLPEALALVQVVREELPGAFTALGGPAIHQVVVHYDAQQRARILERVDAIGLYEGEALLERLLPMLVAGRRELGTVPNLLAMGPAGPVLGPRWTLLPKDSPAPDYDDLDLDSYLAPSRTLLYAPTRGCYWGRCSFCYYGLAETSTAAYREVPPDVAATQLRALTERHGARHVYLSCDVLSPSYAVRLATALVEQGVELTWSSDLKIERFFTDERCTLLYRSGLRAAAFGIESGSDRILTLIDKGCDRATLTAVNRRFHAAGIATEWMAFTDHPDETVDEALETIEWVAEEQGAIDLFIVGQFGLERGSLIAQHPERYGVAEVRYAQGDDLRLYAQYVPISAPRTPEETARIDSVLAAVSARYSLRPYPWAGANSTHHTLLWVLRRGQGALRRDAQGLLPLPRAPSVPGLPRRLRRDPGALAERVEGFRRRYLARALYTTLPGAPQLLELSYTDYLGAVALEPALD